MIKAELSLLGKTLELSTDDNTFIEMREDQNVCSLVVRASVKKLNELFVSDLIGVHLENFTADGVNMYKNLYGRRLSSYNKKIRNNPVTNVTEKEMVFMFIKDIEGVE